MERSYLVGEYLTLSVTVSDNCRVTVAHGLAGERGRAIEILPRE